jgi:hypothetical protein
MNQYKTPSVLRLRTFNLTETQTNKKKDIEIKNQAQPHRFMHLGTCCEEEYHRPLPPPSPPPPPDGAIIEEGSNMSCSDEYCRWWWFDRICLIAAPLMAPRSGMRRERETRYRQRAEKNDQAVCLNLFGREKGRQRGEVVKN